MTQKVRETTQTPAQAIAEAYPNGNVPALADLAAGELEPTDLSWENWTHPIKVTPEVVLELSVHGTPVQWWTVKHDLIHTHYGGEGGWVQVLPGNLRSVISRGRHDSGAVLRPVLVEDTPIEGGGE